MGCLVHRLKIKKNQTSRFVHKDMLKRGVFLDEKAIAAL